MEDIDEADVIFVEQFQNSLQERCEYMVFVIVVSTESLVKKIIQFSLSILLASPWTISSILHAL